MPLGVDAGIVEKSGSWYSYDGERIGQGREKARTFLKEHPDACMRLAEEVYLAKGLKLAVPAVDPDGMSTETAKTTKTTETSETTKTTEPSSAEEDE